MATVTKQEYQNASNAVNSTYTADSLNNYKSAYSNYMSQGMSSADAAKKASSLLVKNGATTTSSTPTQTTQTTSNNRTTANTQPTQTNTQPTYSNNTQTQNQTSTPTNTNAVNTDNIKKGWDNLSYEQQQEKLKQIPGLKDSITKKGWTIKTADGQITQQTTPQQSNVSNDGWDYQDNSPERMMQMANNLEQMYQTDPGLFANEQTFKNFFINGKGRTPEQEQFLLDYYKNRKIYNEYDGLTSAKVGSMAANGQVPESYLNYLKNSNPQRYQEVMAGKEQEENRIKDNSSYSDLLTQAGFEDTANTAWQKKEGLLVDENNNLIDDRLYHEPTAEEREKVDRINEIDSEVLDIENTYKHTYDDLVKKYPGATKATLMAMAQDRCSDLLRRKEDLMVERTKLAGTVEYLQSERQAQDDAGKQTIANLQKNLGMYYDYSPEGMAEYAQNQYAATNVTLDQADNGTDTQKQMALESVLDDYYDKYGSIIQRSEAQVIGDVMRYAKDKGISLNQALEENFLKPLRGKPEFQTLSSGGALGYEPKIYKIGDNGYYFDENGNLVSIGGGAGTETSGGGGDIAGSEWSNGNQVKLGETAVDTGIKNVYGSNVKLAPTVGNMLQEAVDKLKSQGIDLQVGDSYRSYETQAKAYAEDQAKPADQRKGVAAPGKSFHELGQAIDVAQSQMNDPAVIQALLDAGFTRPVKSEPRHWSYGEGVDQFGGKKSNGSNGSNSLGYNPDLETFFSKWRDGAGDRLKEKDFWATFAKDIEGKGVSKDDFLKQYGEWYAFTSRDAYEKLLSDIDHLIELTGDEFSKTERAGVLSGIGTTAKVYKYIRNNQTLNAIIDAKNRGAKLGVLSDSDVKMLKEAASILDWDVDQETWAKELYDYRESILNNNKYLREKYGRQSAYSTDKLFDYDNNNKKYTISSKGGSGSTKKTGKSITTLGR